MRKKLLLGVTALAIAVGVGMAPVANAFNPNLPIFPGFGNNGFFGSIQRPVTFGPNPGLNAVLANNNAISNRVPGLTGQLTANTVRLINSVIPPVSPSGNRSFR